MVNTRLPPIPKTVQPAAVKTVPSVEDCPDCQGQAKLRALTKNKQILTKQSDATSMRYMKYLTRNNNSNSNNNNNNKTKNIKFQEVLKDLRQTMKNPMMVPLTDSFFRFDLI